METILADDLATGVVPLAEATDVSVYGSKAIGLGDAIRDGLPVPPGFALAGPVVEAVAAEDEETIERVLSTLRGLRTPLAVRSSAVDEDGKDASFAGQHLTLLNVPSIDDVPAALREIWWSANSDSAITYRQRVGLFTRPSVGVVVQSLLDPRGGGGDVHAEPGHRCRRARHRVGLGARRSRRRRARDPRHLSPRARRRDDRVHARTEAHRHPLPCPTAGRTKKTSTRHAPKRSPSTTTCSHSSATSPGTARRSTATRATSNGRSTTARVYLLQCRAVTTTSAKSAAIDPTAVVPENDPADVLTSVPLFVGPQRRRSGSDRVAVQGAPVRPGRRRDP